MSDFKAKMHQIVCRLGLRPRPAGGAYPRHPSWILGAYFEGRGRERAGEGRGEEESQGREG